MWRLRIAFRDARPGLPMPCPLRHRMNCTMPPACSLLLSTVPPPVPSTSLGYGPPLPLVIGRIAGPADLRRGARGSRRPGLVPAVPPHVIIVSCVVNPGVSMHADALSLPQNCHRSATPRDSCLLPAYINAQHLSLVPPCIRTRSPSSKWTAFDTGPGVPLVASNTTAVPPA